MRVLVTGGGGFLGGAIVRMLVTRGDRVVTLQRGDYPWLRDLGVEAKRGDLADADVVKQACEDIDAVVHAAAKAGVWGRYDDYHRANVVGARNVIAACRSRGVPRLVYTSSPSVVFDGRDESGIDESAPYPQRHLAHYPRTKAIAEREVLAANDDELATVALRPHLIWGPGDPHLVPRIVGRARAGRLRLVGDGSNRVDSTCIDNAAAAHVLALDRLARREPAAKGATGTPSPRTIPVQVVEENSARVSSADSAYPWRPSPACFPGGNAYFISNGEPLAMSQLINRILDAAGLPPVTKRVPPRVAYAAGAVLEAAHKLLRIRREPIMTRFVARQLATEHWFDISAARRDLGYAPAVSIDEGLRRLAEAMRS